MRFFLHLSYQGTNYRGWQSQGKGQSVQEAIEKALSKILNTPTTCMGCGRTDAQVHASEYFLHFEAVQKPPENMAQVLNKILPSDICIYNIIPVNDKAHARFDVKFRTYNYFIHTQKDPFLTNKSSYYPIVGLDIEKMKKAIAIIQNTRDFRSLCKTPDAHNHTRCQIQNIRLFCDHTKQKIRIQIKADRFLRGMIRIMVHHFLQLAQHKMTLADFQVLITEKKSSKHLKFAHPQGLYLSKIEYPYLQIQTNEKFDFISNQNWIEI
jgi:tRNA pseudouridine38-40 synthase